MKKRPSPKSIGSSNREKPLQFADRFHESGDFFPSVVKVETGARRRGDSEPFHQWLRAVMPAAQSDSFLIGEGHDVVRMKIVEVEADDSGPLSFRAKDANSRECPELARSFSGKCMPRLESSLPRHRLQISDSG